MEVTKDTNLYQDQSDNRFIMFDCHICGREFPLNFLLKRHLEKHERNNIQVNPFKCSKCNIKFDKEENMNCHLLYCTNNFRIIWKKFLTLKPNIYTTPTNETEISQINAVNSNEGIVDTIPHVQIQHDSDTNINYNEAIKLRRSVRIKNALNEMASLRPSLQRSSTKIESDLLTNTNSEQAGPPQVTTVISRKRSYNNCIDNGIDNYTNKEKHRCVMCKTEFPSELTLISHNKTFHIKQEKQAENNDNCLSESKTNKLKVCHLCKRQFAYHISLFNHLKAHSRVPYKCQYCDDTFKLKRAFTSHKCKYIIEQRPKKLTNDNNQQPQPNLCELCGKCYSSTSNLRRHHYIAHEPNTEVDCHICNKTFGHKYSLQAHLRMQHEQVLINGKIIYIKNEIMKYHCNICQMDFDSYIEFQHHSTTHIGMYSCGDCGQRFDTNYSLGEHIVRVHDTTEINDDNNNM